MKNDQGAAQSTLPVTQADRDLARAFFVSRSAAFPALAVQENRDLVEAFAFARRQLGSTPGRTVPACRSCGGPSPNGDPCETCVECERILAMSDEEVVAEAGPEGMAWARGFKEGLRAGLSGRKTIPEPTDPAGVSEMRETAARETVAQKNLDLALANDPRSVSPLEASKAFMELTSMYSHRGDGVPTRYVHSPAVADAALIMWLALITALRTPVVPDEALAARAEAE